MVVVVVVLVVSVVWWWLWWFCCRRTVYFTCDVAEVLPLALAMIFMHCI